MPLLDTLEVWFTQKPQRRPQSPSAERFVSSFKWLTNWLSPPFPDRDMKATDFDCLSLYLRCAWAMVFRLILSYTIFWVAGLIWVGLWLWHSFPILFHPGRMQAHVWHSFWKAVGPGLVAKQFYMIPLAPLAWALFALIIYLPRALFWNRRARRLLAAGETAPAGEVVAITGSDTSIWPPPPSQ